MTVFSDPLSSTLPDDQHSLDESRYLTIGFSPGIACYFLFALNAAPASDSSGHGSQLRRSASKLKKASEPDPLAERPNLDFREGVRGGYTNLLAQGTNLVVIAPDLMDTFPDSESVNEALRSLKAIAKRTRKAS